MANPAVPLGTLQIGQRGDFQGQQFIVIERTPRGVSIRRKTKAKDRYDQARWCWVEDEWSAATLVTPEPMPKRGAALRCGARDR